MFKVFVGVGGKMNLQQKILLSLGTVVALVSLSSGVCEQKVSETVQDSQYDSPDHYHYPNMDCFGNGPNDLEEMDKFFETHETRFGDYVPKRSCNQGCGY